MSWRRRRKREEDLDRELRAHLDLEAEEHQDTGLSAEEARYAAHHAFGNLALVKEEVRVMWGWTALETFTQDVRHGLRQFRRSPGFAAVVIATLTLGIGATTAIFSVINGVILRPLPFLDPERLVTLEEREQTSGGWRSFSYLNFLDCERESRSFESMAAWRNEGVNLTAPGEPEFVRARLIADTMGRRRLMLLLLGIFAAVALLLASVGIYGVISYSTNQRVPEIGVRIALGADRRDVLKLVVGQGLALTAVALVFGLGGALALTHFLARLLYGVRPTDPVTYLTVCLVLAGVALLASYVPARRATKVDPMVAVRYE